MTTFADLGLPRPIVNTLAQQGITEPFPIQAAALPDALAGKDVLGRGPTGSGKTFTFGLPMLTRLSESGASKPARPRGLVLAPTRELATQIADRLADPAAAVGLRVLSVVGGVNINTQIRSLARPVDVLIATPGRAQDLVNQRKLHLDDVVITALDEADHMADMGFLPQVKRLLDLTPKKGQRLLFSATLDGDIQKLVDRYMDSPVTHSTAAVEASVDTMAHFLVHAGSRENRNDLVPFIAARDGKTIMFMRTKHGVDRQTKKLRRVGINAEPLHGDKGQGARTRALEGFTDGSVPVLVATDIAARGIDINDVSLVVHVDPPAEHKAYLHRAGRTARAGTSGTVVTLVMDTQTDEVTKLMRKAKVNAEEISVTDSNDSRAMNQLASITGGRTPSGAPLPPPGAPAGGLQKPVTAKNKTAGKDNKGGKPRDGGRRRSSGNSGRAEGGRAQGRGRSGGSSRGGNRGGSTRSGGNRGGRRSGS